LEIATGFRRLARGGYCHRRREVGRRIVNTEWDLFMFFLGFAVGGLAVLAGLLLARVRREGLREGDRFLSRLGSVGAQRFLEVAQD
jgi:hypothetical protein